MGSDPAKGLSSTARTDPSLDDPSAGKEGTRDIRTFTLLQTLPQIYCGGKNNVGAPRCVKLNMSYCVGGNFDKHPGAHRYLNRQGAGIPSVVNKEGVHRTNGKWFTKGGDEGSYWSEEVNEASGGNSEE